MPLIYHRREWAGLLFLLVEELCFRHGAVWAITRTFCIDARTSHELLDRVDRFGAVVDGLMMLAAHDDRFLWACIHAKTTVDAAHHVDIKPGREFLDLRVGMLAGFDVNAFRRADRRAHVAGDAFQAAVVSDR